MSALAVLLDSLVDYAGLFPPAKLPMAEAVRNYAAYRAGPHRAILGRFIVPLARLPEFEAAVRQLEPGIPQAWELSVLGGADGAADRLLIEAFNARHPTARIVAVETKATTLAELRRATGGLPSSLEVWIEIPTASPGLPSLLQAIKEAGHFAKIRTGGVTPESIPSSLDVAHFLMACRRADLVFKATAGLHHPLRGLYPLTYQADAPSGRLFGFLNVFLAAALIAAEGSAQEIGDLLDDSDGRNFFVHPEAMAWRGHRFTVEQLARMRRNSCRSFGSCSFTEPIEGLQDLHWL
ncbi:MAG: hypothetical protein Q8J74_08050 [Candidatus Didemnitutus sp.]|nr:hypothetical protein [Candidatus Didemnitutus sp.]